MVTAMTLTIVAFIIIFVEVGGYSQVRMFVTLFILVTFVNISL
jgi:hypothetical protein